jgi:hypothetical protein
MRRRWVLPVVVVTALGALPSALGNPSVNRTCVFRGSKKLGCVHPTGRGPWPHTSSWGVNEGCGSWVWGNRSWLWYQENMTKVAAAKRVNGDHWRVLDWEEAPVKTLGYVVRRGQESWDVQGPTGRRRAVARGPDGPPAGLIVLADTSCLPKG